MGSADNASRVDNTTTEAEGFKVAGFSYWTAYAPCCEKNPNYDPYADTFDCIYYDACSNPGLFTADMVGQQSLEWVEENNVVAFYDASDPNGDNF
jgi:beta-xylosidase